MAELVLSVCWQNHNSELATEYRSLWENNFLVDCTLSAEGQSLKAHRLVLSACSPYFQTLFHEEAEKHPFVVLVNATFETLKAVIDFVYRGETRIPQGNLKAFLTLAQALQIKGLDDDDYVNKNGSGNSAGKAPRSPSEDNHDICVVQGFQEDDHENYSQHLSHPSDSYSDSAHRNTSDLTEERSTCEEVELPLQEHHILVGYNEVSEVAEVTVKQEPLFSELLVTKKRLINVNRNKTVTASFKSKNDRSSSVTRGERDLNQSSSGRGNADSPVIPSQPQQLTQLNNKESSDRDVDVQIQLLLPEILDLKSEERDGSESEEHMSDHDATGNDADEMDEETEPALGEENLHQRSSADDLPLEEDVATQRRSLPRQQSTSSPPHTELQLHEGRHAHPGEQTVLSDEGGVALAHLPSTSARKPRRKRATCKLCQKIYASASILDSHVCSHTGKRSFLCDVCGQIFAQKAHLTLHKRIHKQVAPNRCSVCAKDFSSSTDLESHMKSHPGLGARERRYRCEVCGKGFTQSSSLTKHIRCHTGERPYICDVCGKGFTCASSLSTHKRMHTGVRPYRCDVCGKTFAQSGSLTTHLRGHTGERPHRCDVCGKGFTQSANLKTHIRNHTGERPFRCDVCGKGFTSKGNLAIHKKVHLGVRSHRCDVCGKTFGQAFSLSSHMRGHTGERPYSCEYCGKAFTNLSTLYGHRRTHTGERPFSCKVCGMRFTQRNHLTIHARRHTGERPYLCDFCGKDFPYKDSLRQHRHRHTGERPFGCDKCALTFSHRGLLSAHKRSTHAAAPTESTREGECS